MRLVKAISCACGKGAEDWGGEYKPHFEVRFKNRHSLIICQPALDELYSLLIDINAPSFWSEEDHSPWIFLDSYDGTHCAECGEIEEDWLHHVEFPEENLSLCGDHYREFVGLIRERVETDCDYEHALEFEIREKVWR